ncbi:MAG TPA: hypothetical protein VGU65_07795 [Frateuria sp.]|nr:hypothetical protein [Frateuria sp.]
MRWIGPAARPASRAAPRSIGIVGGSYMAVKFACLLRTPVTLFPQ